MGFSALGWGTGSTSVGCGSDRVARGYTWVDVDEFLTESLQRGGGLAPRSWKVGQSPGGWIFAHRAFLGQAMDRLLAGAVSRSGADDTIILGGTWARHPLPTPASAGPGPVIIDGLTLWVSDSWDTLRGEPAAVGAQVVTLWVPANPATAGPVSPGSANCRGVLTAPTRSAPEIRCGPAED